MLDLCTFVYFVLSLLFAPDSSRHAILMVVKMDECKGRS